MQPIAAFSKTHGNGNQLVIDGIVNKEFERQREKLEQAEREHAMEIRCIEMCISKTREQRNKLLAKELKAIEHKLYHKSFVDRIKNVFFFCFACVLILGRKIKLLEWSEEERKWKRRRLCK